MNEISCEICQDLMPLVQDSVASEDSKNAVLHHIAECEQCKALYISNIDLSNFRESEPQKAFSKAQRYLTAVNSVLMLFGIYFGLSLTHRIDMFYNILIMPIVGAAGYLLLGKRSFLIVPALLWSVSIPVNYLLLEKPLNLGMLFWWTLIYAGLAIAGILIAILLKFAFRKEKKQ